MGDNNKRLKNDDLDMTIQACLLAGKIMLQSGAETSRIEDTMRRIAKFHGLNNSQSFVTPTGIIFSFEGLEPTHFIRIHTRGTDLDKVTKVNRISRQLVNGEITNTDALHALEDVDKEDTSYASWLQIFVSVLISGSFLMMFQGKWADCIPAMVAGGLGFAIFLLIEHFTRVKFFADFIASFVIGIVSFFIVAFGYGEELDTIIIASVMPLVPGLLITNAIRDLMAGHFLSGLSKGAEALLTAFAIGAGVAVVFSLLA